MSAASAWQTTFDSAEHSPVPSDPVAKQNLCLDGSSMMIVCAARPYQHIGSVFEFVVNILYISSLAYVPTKDGTQVTQNGTQPRSFKIALKASETCTTPAIFRAFNLQARLPAPVI